MVIRDLWGSSPGRILMGISLRNFEDLNTTPGISTRLKRNLMLLLFPVEGLVLLKDSFAFRLADRWFKTAVLENPKPVLLALCEAIGIPFSESMLSWEPGPRNCDGLWGKYWYDSVWKSSGFSPPTPKEGELSEHLHSVLEESTTIYQELREMRIRT